MLVFNQVREQLFHTIASLEGSFIGKRSFASNSDWSSYSKPIPSVVSISEHADTSLDVSNSFSNY